MSFPAKTIFHLFEKSWHLRIFGFVATLPQAGPFPALKMLSLFHSGPLRGRLALINARTYVKLFSAIPAQLFL